MDVHICCRFSFIIITRLLIISCFSQNGEVAANINANNNNNSNNNADSSAATSWFAEVIELRHRAEEYRRRAQGTHFSREHLLQLLAKQNECWDLDADASSTIKALNLEKPAIRAR